jgi:ankyrin repeat protein
MRRVSKVVWGALVAVIAVGASGCPKPGPAEMLAAIDSGNARRVEELLNRGADPNESIPPPVSGLQVITPTPLAHVIATVPEEAVAVRMMAALVNHGADFDRIGWPQTPWMVLLDSPQPLGKRLQVLLRAGADPNHPLPYAPGCGIPYGEFLLFGSHTAAPLHRRAAYGDTAAVSALLRAGAVVDARMDAGATALHVTAASTPASETQAMAVAEALLHAGADPNTTDRKRRTPLDFAEQAGRQKLAEMLRARGAKHGKEVRSR